MQVGASADARRARLALTNGVGTTASTLETPMKIDAYEDQRKARCP